MKRTMPARVRERWSLRGLSSAILLVVSTVALGSFAALAVAIARVEEAAEAMLRDMASLAIADEIALELSAQERLARAVDPSDEALIDVVGRRKETLLRLARDARSLAGGADELALLDELERDLDGYFDVGTTGKPGAYPRAIHDGGSAELHRALASVEALRSLNQRAILTRQARVERIEHAAHVTALASGSLLLVVIAIAAIALRRGVLEPLESLRAAIDRYRRGERDAPIPTSGPAEIVGIGTAFSDVRDELAQQHADQAAFLAGVAHDLRNPLSPLKQAVALLRRDQEAMPSARASRTLALVDRQIDRLDRMVGDLLDATRIEAGRLELSLADVDLRDVLRECVDLHRASATRHELRLELPREPVVVRADAARLDQVVGNLLSNAIKYSPHGGAIELRVEQDRDEARIVVRDHGIGIAPEHVREVFEPFRRRARARAVAPGVGVGLSVASHIVHAHGGRVSVESAVGQGSTFVVHLPRSS